MILLCGCWGLGVGVVWGFNRFYLRYYRDFVFNGIHLRTALFLEKMIILNLRQDKI